MTELDVLRARQEALETANETLHEAFRTVDGDAHTALEVAKQNVKLMTALRATQLEHGRAIAGLVTEVSDLKADVGSVKADVGSVKADVGSVKADVGNVKADVTDLKADVGSVKADVGELKADLKEGLAEVLRRLPG